MKLDSCPAFSRHENFITKFPYRERRHGVDDDPVKTRLIFFFFFFFSHDPEENYGKLYKLQRFIINDSIFASFTVKKNVRKLNFKRSNPKIRRRRARILQFVGYRINAFSRIFVADSSSLIHYSDILRLIHPPAGLTFGIRFNRARPSSGSWLAALDRIVCNRNAWRKLAHM